jgi:hypothetical protein
MARRNVFIQAAILLALVWACVWGVRTLASSRKVTAERLQREISLASFADWSDRVNGGEGAEASRREERLKEIADLVNRLDFQEREKNRESRSVENFFKKLSGSERNLFIELTIMESMDRFMESLDAMSPEQRKKFVEQGMKEIREGRTEEEMARVDTLGDELLSRISEEGMRAYYEKSSTETKLDLAPLMEAMNESMQGLRGNEFGPR